MAKVSARNVEPQAQTALSNSPIYELRDLRVEQCGEGLLISGIVSSFYHKQLAQEVVRATCEGLEIELVNSIRVHVTQ